MFKLLFSAALFITLVVNIVFLFVAKDKPPDSGITSTFEPFLAVESSQSYHQRLFLRSNDFYDYPAQTAVAAAATETAAVNSIEPPFSTNKPEAQHKRSEQKLDEQSPSRIASRILASDIASSQTDAGSSSRGKGFITSSRRGSRMQSPSGQVVGQHIQIDSSETTRKIEPGNNNANDDSMTAGRRSSRFMPSNGQQQQVRIPLHHNESYNHDKQKQQQQPTTLNIRVKSSKNHVFVSVNDLIIYESKSHSVNRLAKTKRARHDSHLQQQHHHPQDNNEIIAAAAAAAASDREDMGRSEEHRVRGDIVLDDDDDDGVGSDEGRGIHVVVLNEYHGYVMARRVFDTYLPGQDEELCYFINMIRDGRILIFAIKDEGSYKMAPNSVGRELLLKLGSEHASRLGWRDMWAFVVQKSTLLETNLAIGQSRANQRLRLRKAVNLGEAFMKSRAFSEWAPAVILDTKVQLLAIGERIKMLAKATNEDDPTSLACGWASGARDEDRRRLRFCSRVEGFARVCDCDHPTQIDFEPSQIQNSRLNGVPIVVMASNRAHYLYRMLRSLLAANGVNSSLVSVFIDGFYEEPLQVSQLFAVRAIQQRPQSRRSARISHHYKSSLTATFETLFPSAEFAIIFEEDLDVAQDALVYFNQTADLLRRDSSLYCVSAWNDQGYEHTVSIDTAGLTYRVETMPGLGWMLSRNLYKQELEPNWPSSTQPHDWDMWIRSAPIRRGRECIIPDVSRTFHFGSSGTNINAYFQRQYFSKHAFARATRQYVGIEDDGEKKLHLTRFRDLDKLTQDSYEIHINQLLSSAKVLQARGQNATEYICSLADRQELASSLDRPGSSSDDAETAETITHSSVIYIEMIDEHDYANWLSLAKCWHIWDLDARGQHKSMWRLHLAGKPVFVVGVPASPYAKHKPPDLEPFAFAESTRRN